MINMHRKFSAKQQKGYATLAITVVVLLLITLIAFVTARAVLTEQQTTNSQYHTQQAFNAAQAGLDYGLVYLNKNQSAVTDGMTLSGSLPDGSTYGITYTFIGGSSDTIKITSKGVSKDGTAERSVQQLVKLVTSGGGTIPETPLSARGQVDLSGSAIVTNLEGSKTVSTGDPAPTVSGHAQTVLSSGVSSTSSGIGSDISYDATLGGYTDTQLQINVLGVTIAQLGASATVTATGSGNTNYNTLVDGLTGVTIHITQDGSAELNSNTVVGSSDKPVNLVITGDLKLSGNLIIYGNVITTGAVDISGNVQIYGLVFSLGDIGVESSVSGNTQIHGGIVVGGIFSGSGNASISYDSAILEDTLSIITGDYAKVPGSWKDISEG